MQHQLRIPEHKEPSRNNRHNNPTSPMQEPRNIPVSTSSRMMDHSPMNHNERAPNPSHNKNPTSSHHRCIPNTHLYNMGGNQEHQEPMRSHKKDKKPIFRM